VYVDGKSRATSTHAYDTAVGPVILGVRPDMTSGNTYDGEIDDIRIYNRALAQNEMAELYQWERARGVRQPKADHAQARSAEG